jgi:hypothetical protein
MSATPATPADATPRLGRVHRQRLRAVWRSAGWPCQDTVEAELLAAGWLERLRDADGRETLRVSDAGVRVLADTLAGNRRQRDAHEALVARVATEMQRAGRLVWRGLSLRAATEAGWTMAMPDVFSIRHTTVEAYVEPRVHEIKVRRADLLADLRRPAKGEAYRALASQCWYVLAEGVGDERDVPEAYGVMLAPAGSGPMQVLRPAPARPMTLPLATWMALARAAPLPPDDDPAQPDLAPCDPPPAPGADPAR